MLSPVTITKQSPFLGEECSLCKNPFAPGDEVVICPEDSSRHHTHCWRANGSKCAAYGCSGHGEIEAPEPTEPEPSPEATDDQPLPTEPNRLQRTARRFGCGQGCLLVGIAIAIIFFSIGCFGLWAIADYIMLEVLGWHYRVPEAGAILPQIVLWLI
ncbi:RING finger protein [Candidatus Leptofilum sp.]|uniref:RING finger protein n=1 Tax=Candidatus Leptofilum sp. TaxID=3241576 RepID=UPI003B5AF006